MDELARQLSNLAENSALQLIANPFPKPVPIQLFLKRDDLLHTLVSGNKWRKLKYNLLIAKEQGFNTLLTFGGAYSNHLYAMAAAGREFGFSTIGVVRGEELATKPLNETLTFCKSCGMHLYFVSRTDYNRKDDPGFLTDLADRFGSCYVLPEGGTNELAIRGTAEVIPEIITQLGYSPDYVCCPVGTGGTVAGLAKSAPSETQALGFLSLKTDHFQLPASLENADSIHIEMAYSFGGYARVTPTLLNFIRAFERRTNVTIEQVYTGKMLYGIYDLAREGYFKDAATVVAVHTGGLQGRSKLLDEDR